MWAEFFDRTRPHLLAHYLAGSKLPPTQLLGVSSQPRVAGGRDVPRPSSRPLAEPFRAGHFNPLPEPGAEAVEH